LPGCTSFFDPRKTKDWYEVPPPRDECGGAQVHGSASLPRRTVSYSKISSFMIWKYSGRLKKGLFFEFDGV
jgi:hypothetical protein